MKNCKSFRHPSIPETVFRSLSFLSHENVQFCLEKNPSHPHTESWFISVFLSNYLVMCDHIALPPHHICLCVMFLVTASQWINAKLGGCLSAQWKKLLPVGGHLFPQNTTFLRQIRSIIWPMELLTFHIASWLLMRGKPSLCFQFLDHLLFPDKFIRKLLELHFLQIKTAVGIIQWLDQRKMYD